MHHLVGLDWVLVKLPAHLRCFYTRACSPGLSHILQCIILFLWQGRYFFGRGVAVHVRSCHGLAVQDSLSYSNCGIYCWLPLADIGSASDTLLLLT